MAPGTVTYTKHGFRMGSDEVDWSKLQLNTVHNWLGAYSQSSDVGAIRLVIPLSLIS